jgi:hypothetical protein
MFEESRKYTRYTTDEGPFTAILWRWMEGNSDEESRQAVLRLLLHPHIRSFLVRAALGKLNWEYLASDLGLQSLETYTNVPNVAAIYMLHGRRRPDSSDLQVDMGYCGEAAATTFRTKTEGFGARRRMYQHQDEIKRIRKKRAQKKLGQNTIPDAKESAPSRRRVLWTHRRLAHKDIESISYCLLSVFPFFHSGDDRLLIQFHCLLTLAEAIDMILLGTLVDTDSLHFYRDWAAEFGLRIRPPGMPPPVFEGLNRALPTRQDMPLYGLGRANWSPQEIFSFTELFGRHRAEIYGASTINWDFVEKQLQKKKVDKGRLQIMSLYHELSQDPESGLESWSSYRYRVKWLKIHQLKVFLEENQLVSPPRDNNDNYYHILGLEDGALTFPQLETFVRKHGHGSDVWLRAFGPLVLPSLLSKEVWEQIKGKDVVYEPFIIKYCR